MTETSAAQNLEPTPEPTPAVPAGRLSRFSRRKDGEQRGLTLTDGMKARSEKLVADYVEGTKLDGYVAKVDNAVGFLLARENHDCNNEALKAASSPIRIGLWLFLLLFVFGGIWSAFAPLKSAAVAMGRVVVDSNKKSIDHLQGGTVADFYVKEGDVVKKGDKLLRLDDTQAKASFEIYSGQLRAALAAESRLIAERDHLDSITFPNEIWTLGSKEEVQKALDAEEKLFDYRRKSIEGEVGVLDQRIKQLEDEVKALESQEKSAGSQIGLINEEIGTVNTLMKKGQALKPRLLALQREGAQLEGKRGENLAMIARAGQSIGENKLAIINLSNENLSKVVDDLKKTQSQIADLRERVGATRDVLDRILITSPADGRVTGLEYHTVGGVIPPGQVIMSIVPQEVERIIEAYIEPQDIDVVVEGLPAYVRLTAYQVRTVPVFEGKVTYVSADRFDDPKTGASYYKARIELDAEHMKQLTTPVELRPGMPAEVHIVTGSKTPLGYLMDPLSNYFGRAWKEQ